MVNELSYYFCLIKYPSSADIFPYIKIGEKYPLNYLEELSYPDISKLDHLDFILKEIHSEHLEYRCFQIDQCQTRFIEVYKDYSMVYELFTDNVLFSINTQFLIKILNDWRAFLVGFYSEKCYFVPNEYVRPEYWDLLKQQQEDAK